MYPPAFKGTIADTETQYVGVPIHNGRVGIQIAWLDATSAATITLETSAFDAVAAPVESDGEAYHWETETDVTIEGPTGVAAGSVTVHLTDIQARRARLKIVATADCDMIVHVESR